MFKAQRFTFKQCQNEGEEDIFVFCGFFTCGFLLQRRRKKLSEFITFHGEKR